DDQRRQASLIDQVADKLELDAFGVQGADQNHCHWRPHLKIFLAFLASWRFNCNRHDAKNAKIEGASMGFFTREQCLDRLRAQLAAGKPIIGGGAGTGISAKCAEAGGIDLIIIYNSGRFRMAGRGSLSGMMPYGDANQIVMEMAREVLPIVK